MYRYISTIIILVGLASVAYAAPVQVRCQPEPCQIHMNISLSPGGVVPPPIVPPPVVPPPIVPPPLGLATQNICPSTLAQEFHMLPVDGDVYQLQSVTNQLCLEENGSSVGLQTCSAGEKQNFHIIESPSPLIVMGKCLGVLGNSKDEGAAIDLSTCVGSAAQELTYARNVIGRATFKFGHSRQCITLQ